MSDGIEEREEQRLQREQLKHQNQDELLDPDEADEGEPERDDS